MKLPDCRLAAFLIFIIIGAFLSAAPAAADYNSDMENAKISYYAGDYDTALQFYMDAYLKNPSKKLNDFIQKVRAKSQEMSDLSLPVVDPYDGLSRQENLLSVNVSSLFMGAYMIFYERKIDHGLGLAVNIRYARAAHDYGMGIDTADAYGAGLDCNFYPQKKSLHSFFWGPGAVVIYARSFEHYREYYWSADVSTRTLEYTAIIPDLHIGYRWILGPGITIDGLAGTFYPFIPVLRGHVNAGFAF